MWIPSQKLSASFSGVSTITIKTFSILLGPLGICKASPFWSLPWTSSCPFYLLCLRACLLLSLSWQWAFSISSFHATVFGWTHCFIVFCNFYHLGKKKKKNLFTFFSISQSFHILYFQSSNGKISLTVFLNTVFISSSTCFSILSWDYYVSQFSQLRYKNINKTPFPSKMWKKVLVLQRLRHMIKLIQSKCFHQFIWAMYKFWYVLGMWLTFAMH